jgi:hypothetical protein
LVAGVVLAFIHVDSARAEATNLAAGADSVRHARGPRSSSSSAIEDPAILGSGSAKEVDYYAEFVDQNKFGHRDYSWRSEFPGLEIPENDSICSSRWATTRWNSSIAADLYPAAGRFCQRVCPGAP